MFSSPACGIFSLEKIIQRLRAVPDDMNPVGQARFFERMESQFGVIRIVLNQKNVNQTFVVADAVGLLSKVETRQWKSDATEIFSAIASRSMLSRERFRAPRSTSET